MADAELIAVPGVLLMAFGLAIRAGWFRHWDKRRTMVPPPGHANAGPPPASGSARSLGASSGKPSRAGGTIPHVERLHLERL